jgi:hypothetical protein
VSRLGLFVAVCGLVLAGCRLDADVRMTMNPDGSGEVVLAVTVDADVVAQVPGLAGGLQFADAVAAGWTVEGPTSTESGGLAMTLRHSFATAEEATNLLRSIGPPINPDVTITRTATSDEVAVTVAGTASLAGGSFDAYADANLVQAAGGVPFGPALAAAGATPATSMGVVLTLDLPGEITATPGSERDGAVVWELPLDGSTTDLATSARLREGGGGGWDAVGTIALVLMIAWLLAGIALAVLVVRAGRRRRRSRYIGNRYR